jgi:hypothetical protein
MQIRMQNSESLTRQQISDSLKAGEEIVFSGASQVEVYAWVERVLVAQEFTGQSTLCSILFPCRIAGCTLSLSRTALFVDKNASLKLYQ